MFQESLNLYLFDDIIIFCSLILWVNSVNVYGFDKYSTISISFKMVSIEINKSKKEMNKKKKYIRDASECRRNDLKKTVKKKNSVVKL